MARDSDSRTNGLGGAGGGSLRLARFGRSAWAGLLIGTLCVVAQWPGALTIPPIDRDEARFAQATRQIVEAARAGDVANVIVPRVQDRARLNKPPLVYWVQGVPAAIFDNAGRESASAGALPTGNIWAFRIPSLVCAMLSALLTWRLGLAMRLHPLAALMGGAFMAVCLVQLVDARQARADQLLLTLTLATQLCLWKVWDGRWRERARLAPVLGFWLFLALGVMTKGPVTPMVALLCIGTLGVWGREWGWIRRLKPGVGVVIVAAIVLAWVVPVAGIVGFGEYWRIVVDETLGRAGAAKESHWGPPGYHLVLLAVLLFPGSMMTAAGVVRAFSRVFGAGGHGSERGEKKASNLAPIRWIVAVTRRRGGRGWEVFCLAWVVPSWIVFELVATKLPHYTLPLYPAIALLTARGLLAIGAHPERARADRGLMAGLVVFVVLGGAIVVGAPVGLALWGGARWAVLVLALAGVIVVVSAARMWSMRLISAQWWMIGASVLAAVCTFGFVLPRHSQLWTSSRIVRVVERADDGFPSSGTPIGAVGYQEDSLVFLTRGRLERVRRREIGAWFEANPDGVLVVQADGDEDAWRGGVEVVGAVRGFNYSTGERVVVEVLEMRDER